ncbi:SIR2 family histone deacetylase [Penicillium angulare]|uniref:SIR2 family histone deacetylase n=1 Tax=Penicillium angulare TaxID=116970 RepID=A0A9W9K6A6_9EURO|nr:SIR2 family histone deacetylase [Penicillium angulare]
MGGNETPTVTPPPLIPAADLESFSKHLKRSTRILALLGAGISASSGLPTFRGAGGFWRSYDATSLATPEAFEENPGLVWQFYSYRRHMALQAKPNKAHYALAELSRRNKDFITISQNVDGLSPRANHPVNKLHLLHGSLFDVKCTNVTCNYVGKDDFTDPIVPALDIPKTGIKLPSATDNEGKTAAAQTTVPGSEPKHSESSGEVDISDAEVPIPKLEPADLPKCPECDGLLRPGVVWFGEPLPTATMNTVDAWVEGSKVDLMLVIGTSSKVWPAAGYIHTARAGGARIAVINMDENDLSGRNLRRGDWFFKGDAAAIVPEILKSVIGEI